MTKKLFLVIAITIIVCTVGWSGTKPVSPQPGWEVVDLKVVKVFSARDGEAAFRAYLVNWKDQDVVVSDNLIKTDYHVGDTMPVLVIRNKFPNAKPGPDLLSFMPASH
jgi:hypothetical protein